jgi:hypothetical protein
VWLPSDDAKGKHGALQMLAILAIASVVLIACGPAPSVTASASPAAQRHVCGDELGPDCDEAIAIVIAHVPELASSPVAVADVEEIGSTQRKGGGYDVIVSFAPVPGVDTWMNPPTWTVFFKIFSAGSPTPSRWIGRSLPDHYLRLLETAGLG